MSGEEDIRFNGLVGQRSLVCRPVQFFGVDTVCRPCLNNLFLHRLELVRRPRPE
jgi:hypothetical protein